MSKYTIHIMLVAALLWFAHSIAPHLERWSEPPKVQTTKRIQA